MSQLPEGSPTSLGLMRKAYWRWLALITEESEKGKYPKVRFNTLSVRLCRRRLFIVSRGRAASPPS